MPGGGGRMAVTTGGAESPVPAAGAAPTGRPHLRRLTGLRAFAALAVVGYHLGAFLRWQPVFRDGYAGVGFFFVLSGFVVTWATRDGDRTAFWRRRAARIWPLHALTAAASLVLGWHTYRPTLGATVANLALVQSWVPRPEVTWSLNAPSWSLACEAFFYASWPFLFVAVRRLSLRRAAAVTAAAWTAELVVTAAGSLRPGAWTMFAYASPLCRLPEFLAGMVLANAVADGWRPALRVPAAVGALLAAATAVRLTHLPGYLPGLVLDPAFVALIAAAACADLRRRPGVLTHPWLVRAGEVSFAFYLVHQAVLVHLGRAGSGPAGLPREGLALAVAAAVAVALHHLVERPAYARLRVPSGRRPAAPSAGAPIAAAS